MTPAAESDYGRFVRRRELYLLIGDLDKPHHLPECECPDCERWRTENGRPTHEYLRSLDQ